LKQVKSIKINILDYFDYSKIETIIDISKVLELEINDSETNQVDMFVALFKNITSLKFGDLTF
jgi:hypothetical protein